METNPDWNLLTKYINNECSDTEKALFKQWLGLSNENQEYFNQMKEAWGAYGSNHASFTPDKKLAWQKLESTIGEDKSKIRKLVIWSASVAASVLLLVSLFYVINNYHNKSNNYELITLITEKTSNHRKLILPDSTVVWLNKSTIIKYPKEFAQNERRVFLNGEAFFEIAHDPNKPFLIETQNTITKDIGTSFNLRAYDNENEVKIVVNSGIVAFYSKTEQNHQIILTKDLAGTFNKKDNKLVKAEVFDVNYLSWKTGKFRFTKANLSEVCKTLENYYNKTIIIKDPELQNMKISATFNNQKLAEVIDLISQTLDIGYQGKNDSIQFFLK